MIFHGVKSSSFLFSYLKGRCFMGADVFCIGFDITIEKTGGMITGFTHENPHLDELASVLLVERYADEEFIRQHCQDGKIFLGIGGGDFDEHTIGGVGKEGECCTTLVAKALNIPKDDLALVKLLSFVKAVDVDGLADPRDISSIAKIMYGLFPDDPGRVVNWVLTGIDTKLLNGNKECFLLEHVAKVMKGLQEYGPDYASGWLEQGLQALKLSQLQFEAALFDLEKAWKFKVNGFSIVVAKSDNPVFQKAARSEKGGIRADVVIQKKSSGNICVFCNRHSIPQKKADWIAAMIRLEETRLRTGEAEFSLDLFRDGKKSEDDIWFYHRRGKLMLNGSKTHKDIPPTRISLRRIFTFVEACLRRS